jgi:hypothetical protein
VTDNFLALELTWWEKGNGVVLEAGICACRCRNIDAMVSFAATVEPWFRSDSVAFALFRILGRRSLMKIIEELITLYLSGWIR